MVAGPNSWWTQAREELAAARKLKATGLARQAYHNAGQAVEFALKAIYMKRKGLAAWPSECKGARWHSLPRIATEAGLDGDIQAMQSDRKRYENWLTVREWDSNGRFPGNAPSKQELNDLFSAVCNESDGVMVWLESIFQNC